VHGLLIIGFFSLAHRSFYLTNESVYAIQKYHICCKACNRLKNTLHVKSDQQFIYLFALFMEGNSHHDYDCGGDEEKAVQEHS